MKLTKTLTRSLPLAAVVVAALPLIGCGPTVFQGNTGLKIIGDLPPAPAPPPKPVVAPKVERVQLLADKIVITEKIQFEYDRATILEVSHSLLDEVTKVVQDNPQVKKIRIEGHASREQKTPLADSYNKVLSDKRAKAVMAYLVTKGVDQKRLEAVGFGVEKPLADNDTDAGREKNRRVEFNIVEQDQAAKKVPQGDKKPEEKKP